MGRLLGQPISGFRGCPTMYSLWECLPLSNFADNEEGWTLTEPHAQLYRERHDSKVLELHEHTVYLTTSRRLSTG